MKETKEVIAPPSADTVENTLIRAEFNKFKNPQRSFSSDASI